MKFSGKKTVVLLFVLILLISGCSNGSRPPGSNGDAAQPAPEQTGQAGQQTPGGNEHAPPLNQPPGQGTAILPTAAEMARIGANEMGRIMILEYHVIGETDGRWARSYTSMRKDLEKLYQAGYVLTSLEDVIKGEISVPAGKTPVVLTFDDGTPGQFRYLVDPAGNTSIDPKSGVGVLTDFFAAHPDFGLEATFFINYYTPFGQGDDLSRKKIKEIIDLGMDIGNHSVNHLRMNTLSQEEVAKELALIVKKVRDIVPGSGYEVNTFALPFGIGTKDPEWSVRGEYQGVAYEHIGVLLVGSTPVVSPYHKRFTPYALERVQVYEDNLDKWLDYFDKNPLQRFVSDGDPKMVAFPAELAEHLRPDIEKTILTYERP